MLGAKMCAWVAWVLLIGLWEPLALRARVVRAAFVHSGPRAVKERVCGMSVRDERMSFVFGALHV